MKSLAFSPVSIDSIGKALSGFFESGVSKEAYTRAAASNVVLAGMKPDGFEAAVELLDILAVSHPSRFFIPVIHSSVERLEAAVSTLCVPVSNSSAVCSEVVKLLVPDSVRAAIPSIIRANLIPGLANEVLCVGWDSAVEALLPETDTVYFDSATIPADELLRMLPVLSASPIHTVDFNWARLGLWREEFKRIFDHPQALALLGDISTIVIHSTAFSASAFDVSAYTLAGWFASRLGVGPEALGHAGWECAGKGRQRLTIRIEGALCGSKGPITRVDLLRHAGNGSEAPLAVVNRGERLESSVMCSEPFSMSRQIERDDIASVMERYFLVGESMFNYGLSERIGREMFDLTRGIDG